MKVVAEIGDGKGDLTYAIDAAQAAIESGAHYVKAQMYRRETLTTRTAPTYAVENLGLPASQWESFAKALDYDDWYAVASAVGTDRFFASVFDGEAANEVSRMGCPYIKVASADITHRPLIEHVGATNVPVIQSLGGATYSEWLSAKEWIGHTSVIPLICTLAYPCPPDQAHLDRIRFWNDHNVLKAGYSDHTRGVNAMAVAGEMGAIMVEKHFTIEPGTGGDHDFAIGPDELRGFVDSPPIVYAKEWTTLAGSYYLGPRTIEEKAVTNARRSICAKVDIPQGDLLESDKLTFLRPGTGISPFGLDSLLGTPAVRDYPAGTQIKQ